MIILQNILKTYDNKTTTLKIDELTFESTGLVSIIGDNGSGKSTLLNIIGLLDMDFTGDYTINSLNVENYSISKLRGQVFDYIFQDLNLIEDISIKDNINLKSSLYNLPIISDTDKQKLKRRPNQLSGGEKQLQALNRVLYSNSQIVICDEPTANLDVTNKRIVFEKLKDLSKTKLVLLVSHDIELVNEFSDRVITLRQGEVISDVLINETKPIDKIEVKDLKLNHKPIVRLALIYMKNHLMKLISMTSISLLFLLLTLTLVSFINFDLVNAISTVIKEDTYITVERRAYEIFEYIDYETYITSSLDYIPMTNSLIDTDYDVIVGKVRFTDTVSLGESEALINKDYFIEYYQKDVIDNDIYVVNGINRYELRLVGFTNEEGVIASKKSLKSELDLYSRPTITGGLFLISNTQDDYGYLTKNITYISLSQLKTMTGYTYENEITGNEVLLSNDLYQYIGGSNIGTVLTFNSFESIQSKNLHKSLVNLNDYYPNGAIYHGIVTSPAGTLFNRTIVVSDEVFMDLIDEIPYFDRIELRVTKDNKERIAQFIVDNNLDSENPELGFLLNHSNEINKIKNIVVILIVLFVAATLILMVNYANEVILNKRIEIGLLQTYGVSKPGSLLSTVICILVPLLSVIILSLILSFGVFDVINSTMKSINNQYSFKVLVLTNEHILIYGLLVLMIFVMTSTIAMIKISKLSPKNIFNLN
ncbi:ABC superfamily ATP binding cassette transporter (putative ABC subunit) [Paracholeplasma brassicae]|uniref:ABC superfamily ATP binding cassette transporter (Putative ABC subunit) n=1 Tax=Acholeplasma brassicae TaxID=61635 RepID=U4KM44_9MOLU|nr:ABC transporter ATP-binding protein [Paracholeplasma brassicae]CCV65152.1 ABC superfamily ATP binding cassette transporter (putative ABC subunit) [Paracholeplasma brassicae]